MRSAFVRVRRVVAQQVAVLLDHRAAAGRVHHDRFGARFEVRPPGVDVALHVVERAVLIVQVMADRAAAAGLAARRSSRCRARRARGSVASLTLRRHRRLHAAGEHQHLARMPARPERARHVCVAGGTLVASASGSIGRTALPIFIAGSNSQRRVKSFAQRGALEPFAQRPRLGSARSSTTLAADVDEAAVLHARRTRRLAVAAGQAAIEMQPRRRAWPGAPSSTSLIR